MKTSLNVPRTEEGKELEADEAEVKMSRKSKVKLASMQAWSGAESSEEEPENHAMLRSFFDIQHIVSFELCPPGTT